MTDPQDGPMEGAAVAPATLDAVAETVPGAMGSSPLALPRAAWWAIVKRVYVMTGFHNLSLLAAGVAFYAFLAFVPLIASIVLLYGLVGDPQTVAQSIDLLKGLAPSEVLTILRDQLLAIVTSSKTAQGFGLLLAIFVALYGAMRAATAMIAALNIINEEPETRSVFRTTAVAALITIGMVGVALVGVLSISVFTYVSNFLAPWLGTGTALLIQLATWAFAGALVSFTFAIFFRYAPDRRAAKWRWLSVGSVLSTLLWVAITAGFGFYVSDISDYNATYGSLAAVVIFLMWLFLSAYAVLIGAEVNAEMERQTMVDSTVGPDRPIGQRGAAMADSVVVDEASRALLEKKRQRESRRKANRV
ncbi:YihY/virulence factor BrkB family protein [Sphingobium sufflavum]|uniref:YihY/virulence factor BrkB family protein n=1 Tax=Sphingobium sufflavum TaxID=1129547 RepID=UPI001F40563D|nr:YihY/virulence factor BrkB family protein [Sphingobium sufflavum]MCE7796843.1 YihY/virulence factor BrkB family protein [Sphingobium sufflavum]